MKLINRIFSLFFASLIVISCSEDDDLNTQNVSVGFGSAEYSIKESGVNDGILNIPINVVGESNGPVRVVCEVEGYGENPAKEEVNYLVTDKTLNISPEDKTATLEILMIDDSEINLDRKFKVTMKSVEGGTIDPESNVAIVTIKDNDAIFYEKFTGTWEFTDDAGDKFPATITTYPEGHAKYEKSMELLIDGPQGIPLSYTLLYSYDVSANKVNLTLPVGNISCPSLNFGPDGILDIWSCLFTGNSVSLKGEINLNVSDDFKTIDFDNTNGALGGYLFESGTTNPVGLFFYFANAKLSKK